MNEFPRTHPAAASPSVVLAPRGGPLWRAWDSDLAYSFRRSPVTVFAGLVALLCLLGAFGAPLLAPHDTFDPKTLSLLDASLPPAWVAGGEPTYLLGTDTQGRDILSTI